MSRYLLLGVGLYFLTVEAHAQSKPPLLAERDGDLVTFPEGWQLCDGQDARIVAEPSPDKSLTRFRAPPLPSETPRSPVDSGDRYLVYVRAQRTPAARKSGQGTSLGQNCYAVPVLVPFENRGRATRASVQETESSLRVSVVSETPSPQEKLLLAGKVAGIPKGCVGRTCDYDFDKRNMLVSQELATAKQKGVMSLTRETQSGSPDGDRIVASLVTAGSRSWSYLLPPLPATPMPLVLPTGWVVCGVGHGLTRVGASDVKVANPQANAELELSAAEGKCPAAPDKLTNVKLKLLPAALTSAHLAAARRGELVTEYALDWNPESPQRLSIWLQSSKLAHDSVIRDNTRIWVDGVPQSGNWIEPCDLANNACEYQIEANVNWKQLRVVSLRLEPRNIEPETFDPATGARVTPSDFAIMPVNRWLVPTAPKPIDAQILWRNNPGSNASTITVPLSPPYLRFHEPGTAVACKALNKDDCGQLESVQTAFPAVNLNLTVDKGVANQLRTSRTTGGQPLVVELAALRNVVLVDQVAWAPVLPAPTRVSISVKQCNYNIQQVTAVYADMSDVEVLYSIHASEDACPEAAGWTVTVPADSGVRVSGSLEPMRGQFYRLKLPSIAANASSSILLTLTAPGDVPINPTTQPTLTIRPPPPVVADEVWTTLYNPYDGLETAGPTRSLPYSRLRRISLDRATWIHLSTTLPLNWAFELEGTVVKPCHPTTLTVRGNRRLSFREQLLCLSGVDANAKDPTLIGELRGRASDFLVARGSVERLPTDIMSLGTRRVTLPLEVHPLRLALPLRDFAWVSCGEDPEKTKRIDPYVDVHSGDLVRAMKFGKHTNSNCYLEVGFPLEQAMEERLQKAISDCQEGKALNACVGDAQCNDCLEKKQGQARLEAYNRALQLYGRQRVKVMLSASNDDGKTWSAAIDLRAGQLEFSADDDSSHVRGRGLEVDNVDPSELWAGVYQNLELAEDGRLNVDDYGLVKIQVSHVDTTDYVSTLEDSRSRTEPFEVTIRKMPESSIPGFAYKTTSANKVWTSLGLTGWRGYLTIGVPIGLVRTRNTGFVAKTSSEFAKLEQAAVGAAVLYVVEPWNFDENQAWGAFNLQGQIGFLTSSTFTNLELPHFSGVAGLGLRLPGGTKPTSATEVSSGFMLWLEVTQDKVQGVQLDFLLGFSVKIGTIGN